MWYFSPATQTVAERVLLCMLHRNTHFFQEKKVQSKAEILLCVTVHQCHKGSRETNMTSRWQCLRGVCSVLHLNYYIWIKTKTCIFRIIVGREWGTRWNQHFQLWVIATRPAPPPRTRVIERDLKKVTPVMVWPDRAASWFAASDRLWNDGSQLVLHGIITPCWVERWQSVLYMKRSPSIKKHRVLGQRPTEKWGPDPLSLLQSSIEMSWVIHDYLEYISENIWAVLSNPTCHNKLTHARTRARTQAQKEKVLCLQTFIPKKNKHGESSWVSEWSWGQIKCTTAWLSDTPHSMQEKLISLTLRQSADPVNCGPVFISKELALLPCKFVPIDWILTRKSQALCLLLNFLGLMGWKKQKTILL